MATNQVDMIMEMYRLVNAAEEKNIQLRSVGGIAVHAHNKKKHPLFLREFADLDFAIAKKQRREFETFMPQIGYTSDKELNMLNGDQRQIYYTPEFKVDVFVGVFEMCHKIPLENRLSIDPVTVPLAELLLTKAQILELNRKDALDITSILLNNDVGHGDNEMINLQILNQLFSQDWGLYKTTSINLERVKELVTKGDVSLSTEDGELVLSRIDQIFKSFEETPKPLAWTLRDRVGTRVKWYEEVEEVER